MDPDSDSFINNNFGYGSDFDSKPFFFVSDLFSIEDSGSGSRISSTQKIGIQFQNRL